MFFLLNLFLICELGFSDMLESLVFEAYRLVFVEYRLYKVQVLEQ